MNRLIIFCLLIISSCQSNEEKFILDYGEEDFTAFENTIIYLRGFDMRGKPIYHANSDNDDCESPFILNLDNDKELKSLNYDLIKDNCTPDTVNVLRLFDVYMKYNVCLLGVDSNGIVSVNVDGLEGADLIRVPDTSYLKDYQLKSWKNIKDNWYHRQ